MVLYHTEQRSYEEIAQMMDLPIGTVKSRLNRAAPRLKGQTFRRPGTFFRIRTLCRELSRARRQLFKQATVAGPSRRTGRENIILQCAKAHFASSGAAIQ